MLLVILAACTVGPNYVRPKAETPASYKEVEGWKKAQPQDHVSRGAWWTMYNDPQLNGLEEQVNISNQNLAAAEAQYRAGPRPGAGRQGRLFPDGYRRAQRHQDPHLLQFSRSPGSICNRQ